MLDRREKRKEEILDAAISLFLERGYMNTKIIDIANAAGIGKGTVYEYFDSKETLLLELLNTRVSEDYKRMEEAIREKPSCREKLKAYLLFDIECTSKYKSNVTDFKQLFMSNSNEITQPIMQALFKITHFQFECLLNIIKQGIHTGEFRACDPHVAAACVMGSAAFFMGLLHHPPEELDSAECFHFQQNQFENKEIDVFDFFLKGLSA